MSMQIVKLIQGTPEWHAHRAKHFNASDAPAMMGCSSYKSRSDLIKELATGLTPEVDANTQRRFDD
ncbi:MAG: endonuclease, partial [Comamonas sp.]